MLIIFAVMKTVFIQFYPVDNVDNSVNNLFDCIFSTHFIHNILKIYYLKIYYLFFMCTVCMFG
jgi:hypothetical protein